jgi:indole-3-glycerol phosphate synthase
MSDILAKICYDKRLHIAQSKTLRSVNDLEGLAKSVTAPRGFIRALRKRVEAGQFGLIAEIKKASPSKGLIRADFEPNLLAKAYELGGATCLSVLTDVLYFQGNDAFLGEARNAVSLPTLRKDFILDPYQVIESRALGADCILLIMAALSDEHAMDLEEAAIALEMDVLVEVHNGDELDQALKLKSHLIGVNNRNLKNMQVDIAMTEELAGRIPQDRIVVSESGLYVAADLARMSKAGANCFLVGEALMRQDDVTQAVKTLLTPVSISNLEVG